VLAALDEDELEDESELEEELELEELELPFLLLAIALP